jgi:hypothetical protein
MALNALVCTKQMVLADGTKHHRNQTNSLTYGTDPARLWALTAKPTSMVHQAKLP